jgi:hexosaminidase
VPHGGFYTQEQIKEVVAYAAQRNITVMPEIEMPGHATAAIAAYPHLSCKGLPVEVAQSWSIWRNTYCPGKRSTYEFLEGVLDEVLELFPSKYIHIGGDEAPKDYWEECPDCQRFMAEQGYTDVDQLQSHLVRHFDAYLSARGRRLIGWDEILEGGLAPEATVMSWRGEDGGIQAIQSGHDAVMAPCGWVYFDTYQSKKHKGEPLCIGGYLPWQTVYRYEPIPAELPSDKAHHVLGAQAQLWTEYIPNIENLHYKAFPRICALSEVLWSSKEQRDEAKFRERLLPHMTRLSALGVEGRPVDAV